MWVILTVDTVFLEFTDHVIGPFQREDEARLYAIEKSLDPQHIVQLVSPEISPAIYDGITMACDMPEGMRSHSLCGGCKCDCHSVYRSVD